MGKNFEQILDEARGVGNGARVFVTVVTSQDNGIASYATGELLYYPATVSRSGIITKPERLDTKGGAPLTYFFSDRKLDIDPKSPGPFPNTPRQPFSANAVDKLGMSISKSLTAPGKPIVKFTLHSWGNVTFDVALEPNGNLLFGTGNPIGNLTDRALYLIAFLGVFQPPH